MAYQILDPASLKKYKPSQVHKVGNAYFLNDGVTPKEGTTKEVDTGATGGKGFTLYGPNGTMKAFPNGETPESQTLQTQGWGVTKGSYMVKQLTDAGVDPATIGGIPDDQRAFFASVGSAFGSAAQAGQTVPYTLSQSDLDALMTQAKNDPNIDKYYKDLLTQGTTQFKQAIASIQGDYEATKAYTERQQATDTRQLTEQEAAAGRAFSGFRQQAQEKLKSDQSSVIESNRRQLAQQLQTTGGQFESTFGTAALDAAGNPTIDGQTYKETGGVEGSNQYAKEGDINAKYEGLVGDAEVTHGLTSGTTVSPDSVPDTQDPTTTTTTTNTTDAAPSTPNAPGSANYESDLTHMGDSTKKGVMAGWGYKWTWTNKAKNQGTYVLNK